MKFSTKRKYIVFVFLHLLSSSFSKQTCVNFGTMPAYTATGRVTILSQCPIVSSIPCSPIACLRECLSFGICGFIRYDVQNCRCDLVIEQKAGTFVARKEGVHTIYPSDMLYYSKAEFMKSQFRNNHELIAKGAWPMRSHSLTTESDTQGSIITLDTCAYVDPCALTRCKTEEMCWRTTKKTATCIPHESFTIQGGKFLGGRSGHAFSEESFKGSRITAIEFYCSSQYFHGLRLKYGEVWGNKHGKTINCDGVIPHVIQFTLSPQERITEVSATIGTVGDGNKIINAIRFESNTGGSFIQCGRPGVGGHSVTVMSTGVQLAYISGHSRCRIYGLKFHWLQIV